MPLSENNNKTAITAITIAATTDNTGKKILDWLVTDAGTGVAAGAGIGSVVGAGVAEDA